MGARPTASCSRSFVVDPFLGSPNNVIAMGSAIVMASCCSSSIPTLGLTTLEDIHFFFKGFPTLDMGWSIFGVDQA